MKLSFEPMADYYNVPELFTFNQMDNKYPAVQQTEKDQMMDDYRLTTIAVVAQNIKDNTKLEGSMLNDVINTMIIATMNLYRYERGLEPFNISGMTQALANQHRLAREGNHEDMISKMRRRPNHSANIGGLFTNNPESRLFLRNFMGMTEPIAHTISYTPQDKKMPDVLETGEPWTEDELQTYDDFRAYAADIVAMIASTWDGKAFLMQELDARLFVGIAMSIQDDGVVTIDAFTTSDKPTTI